jgi:hypothetical protein
MTSQHRGQLLSLGVEFWVAPRDGGLPVKVSRDQWNRKAFNGPLPAIKPAFAPSTYDYEVTVPHVSPPFTPGFFCPL